MAIYKYRATLSMDKFPLRASEFGRTVIIPPKGEQVTATENTPQAYYLENVMPTERGYQSLGFDEVITSPLDATLSACKKVYYVANDLHSYHFWINTFTGNVWYAEQGSTQWQLMQHFVSAPEHNPTIAVVAGRTFFWFNNLKELYEFDFGLVQLVLVAPTSISLPDVIAITTLAGYLIAIFPTAVAWSSLIDPLDFVPSLITGAGSGFVENIAGSIKYALAVNNGIILYGISNCVACKYTGNARYPFSFTAISSAGGYLSDALITSTQNGDTHFAWTTVGLQQLNVSEAKMLLPELSDLIADGKIEQYNPITGAVESIPGDQNRALVKKLTLIGSRYLCVSCGIYLVVGGTYQMTYVYDLALGRMGRIVKDHIECFEYKIADYPVDTEFTNNTKHTIALIDSLNNVYLVNLNHTTDFDFSYLILGKYQLQRGNSIQLQEVIIESPSTATEVLIYTLTELEDIALPVITQLTRASTAGNVQRNVCRVTGLYQSIVLFGSFDISAVEIVFKEQGRR